MISVGLHTRPAETADQQQIANLMFFEAYVHRHLDWRSPLEWLGSPNYWALEDRHGRVSAALACPQDPPGIAWLRLFTFSSRLLGPFEPLPSDWGSGGTVRAALEAWSQLWTAVRDEIRCDGGALVAAIVVKSWFQDILEKSGFEKLDSIVMLEWTARLIESHPLPQGISIRPMLPDDLPAVTSTDAAAFEPLWHNSLFSLQKAFSQSVCATVAETADGVVGYQISTGNMLGAHLARLAVRKEAQGRGIGRALLDDLILRLGPQNLARITVNTQADNLASLSIYQKMGFVRTGEQYPVFVHQV